MTILEDLAEYLAAFNIEKVSDLDREALEIHLIDTICATVAGSAAPDGTALLALQSGKSTFAGLRSLSDNPLDDVVVRCASTRLSEIDNIHLPSGTTPGSIIVPTAVVLASHNRSTAQDFSAAVIAGFEAMTRLGMAVDGHSLVYKGIWTTYFTSTFGTAAVTARLLSLDPMDTAHALAIALTLTAGRMGQPGTEKTARWLSAGHAARAGCFAALSAADGFRGDLHLLDGPWMENAQGIEIDRNALLWRYETDTVIPTVSIKPYCSAKQMIAAIAAFEEILSRGIDSTAIDQIDVAVPENYARMIDHGVVGGNRLSSITSAPYQLAMAAFHHDRLYDVARSKYVLDEDVTSLMDKVSVSVDNELGKHLPGRWPARVTVATGAHIETKEVIDAPGDPDAAFNRKRVVAKLHAVADRLIGVQEVEAWLQTVSGAVDDDAAIQELGRRYLEL